MTLNKRKNTFFIGSALLCSAIHGAHDIPHLPGCSINPVAVKEKIHFL